MYEFSLSTPTNLADAVAQQQDSGGKYLAGGQTLVPTLKLRLADPGHLISLRRIAELRTVSEADGFLTLGAGLTHHEVARSVLVQHRLPFLARMAGAIGDPAVRNRGTLGGSVANNDPSADYPAALLALGARVVTNRRELPADEFFQGLFATAITEDGDESELVTAIRLPCLRRAAYAKFKHPASGFALIGVAVVQGDEDQVRVAVTGSGFGVARLREFEAALSQRFAAESLASLSLSPDEFASDSATSADYRAALAKAMTADAVRQIIQGFF
ncbi:MAG: xanthine dehydrogenase family protein subunit M [Candidatus Pacebacteria bacterium]|nr:xanthine dehydrogenase family protein subunit M [Candidatus Paceibacterota bacterium]